jgi:predicted TIM-barrel fold metal-dependent hydrolase
MSEVVDWHAHWVPPELVEFLTARDVAPKVVTENGIRSVVVTPGNSQPVKEAQQDLSLRVAEMDSIGVTRQVLSLAVILGHFLARMPADLEQALVTANNAGLARLVRNHGNRFSGLAVLPLAHLQDAPRVLEKAVGEQGLLGAILPADAFADKASARLLAPIFEVANRLHAHLFVHPGPMPGQDLKPVAADEAQMVRRRAIGFQDSLTAAAVTFEFTDFLDPYPNAVVQLANLGGTIALLADRIAMTAERMELPAHLAEGRLRRIIVDTASFGERGVALAAQTLGADRILFGTDSPALRIAPAYQGIIAAGLSTETTRAILAGTAFSLSSLTKFR